MHTLACRTCIFALHREVSRLLEAQRAFRQLSYFDLRRRSKLTLELTRIAISLPIALERAIQEQREEHARDTADTDNVRDATAGQTVLLNRRVRSILRNSALVLERLEHLLNK